MTRISNLFALSLFVLSCSHPQWSKPGGSQADLESDTVSCNNEIVTSSIGARAITGMGTPTVRGRTAVTGGVRAEVEKALAQCLMEKGWTRQDVP